ncbi:MAG TPA: beta-propeller fold lactonase family protein [Gemmataceae bacterium]|jgi:YVTN family beta-propeller protein|nr:beta-propeller fold lactonase family protein [Gemmataceae bacterium]
MNLRLIYSLTVFALASSSLIAGTSNSLLDLSPDGKMLLAANRDNGTVTVIDTETRKILREIKVGAKPEGVSWIGAGPRAVATLYEDNALVFFDAATGTISKKLPVSAEPYGIVADPQGRTAWVTHEYPGTVSTVDLQNETVVGETKAGSHLRGIALSPDGKRVYVTEFYTGVLAAFDVASGKVVDSWKGHSTDNLARHVLIHPTRPKAYLAHIRSMVTVNNGSGSIFPQLSICDLNPGEGKRRVSFGMDTFNGVYVTTNPWESAMSSDGKRFYVIYAGTDDMNVCRVIDDDYREIEAVGRPSQIGRNPRAIRLSPDNQLVYIYNAMDFTVTVHQADNMKLLDKIKVCEAPMTPEWVRGKILFNSAKPPMTSRRWIACASCHPDGHHDGRVWQQPEGLRKTTALFGVAHTHPLHWSADRDEVQDFEYTIRSQLMQSSTGLAPGPMKRKVGFEKIELTEKTSGRSKDLDALAIYNNSFDFSLSPHILAPGKLTPAATRGKEVFFRKEVSCASCHSGPYYTDSSLEKPFKLHDVGTGNDDPSEKMGPFYDTPTLLGIYRTAPYLHHGKAKTLHEVLTTYNKGDKHGKTSHLKKDEIDDLVSFLQALPYETPPNETPNTVSYRVPAKKEDR